MNYIFKYLLHSIIVFFFQNSNYVYVAPPLLSVIFREFFPNLFLIFYFILATILEPLGKSLSVLNCSVCSPLGSLLFPVWTSSGYFYSTDFALCSARSCFNSPYFLTIFFFRLLCFFFVVGFFFFQSFLKVFLCLFCCCCF